MYVRGLVLALLLNVSLPAIALELDKGSTLDRIEAAYRTGEIDEEQYVLYRLYRVKNKALLPDEFVAPGDQERPVRCGTPMIKAARGAVDWMSPEAKATVGLLLPPTIAATASEESDHFSLIFGEDYTGTPDDIDFWLDAFETSWDVEVDGLGFENPPCTDEYYFDVYLANTGGSSPELEPDTYGYCDHQGDCPFIVVHPDYSFTGNAEGAAQATAAHEFQHGIQSGYDWFEGNYWMEATATWAEDVVFDDVNDYVDYLNGSDGWLAYPEYALTYEDGWHEYGNVLWVKYLSEYWGGDQTIVDIWEAAIDTDALTATGQVMAADGWTLADGFVDFTAQLSVNGFEEAALYDEVYMMGDHDSYPASGAPDQYLPQTFGSNYVKFLPSGAAQDLEVTFSGEAMDGGQVVTWGVALMAVHADGSALYQVLDVDATGEGSAWVVDFGGTVQKVVMAVSVLAGDTGAPGVSYSYTADLGEATIGGDDDDDGGAGDDQGCGCRADGASPVPALAALMLLGTALIRRR